MNFNLKKIRFIRLIVTLVLLAIAFALDYTTEKDFFEFARTHESPPNPYVVETALKEIRPVSWDSIYLPNTVPEFYELGAWTQSDTYISCEFLRPIDYKKETSLGNSYPDLLFTQWNYKREPIYWLESITPPIIKSGTFQTPLYLEDKSEEQLELKINSTLQTQTYNDKEYYFCDETKNGNLLLLWYDKENTLVLAVEPATGNKSHIKITLDEMLAIADSVEIYN